MQRIKRVISVVVFSLLIVLTFRCNVFAEEKIDIEIKAGFDGAYKTGTYAPVNIKIVNNEKDIQGEIQLGIVEDDATTTLFAKEINLPMNSTKNVTIDLPFSENSSKKIYVKLVEENKTYYEEFKTINSWIYADSAFIGILSDEHDNVSYAGNLGSINLPNKKIGQSKSVSLDSKIFPENINVMENFDILIINNFDTSKLNEKQYRALKTWVNNGGTLIIGTGASYNKALGIFKDNYLVGEIGEIKRVSTSSLHRFIGLSSGDMDIDLLDLKIKNSINILEENTVPVIQKIHKGKGTVFVFGCDLGLNPVASWEKRSELIEKLINQTNSNSSLRYTAREEYDRFNGIENRLTNIPELPVPTSIKTMIIFIIYILLISPVSYIILKKKDKRELMWGVVPVISILFVVIMFVTGSATRITTSVINSVNIIEVDKAGNKSVDSFAGILTPTKTDIRIESGDNIELTPIISRRYNRYSAPINPAELKVSDVKATAKIMTGSSEYMDFYSNSVFSNNSVKINNTSPDGNVVCSLNFTDAMYTGKVTNEFDFDLTDAYVLLSKSYIKIGDIKAGETKDIRAKEVSHRGHIYDFGDKVYRNRNNGISSAFMNADEIREIKAGGQKSNLLNIYFGERGIGEGPKLISWSNTDINKGILVNGKSIRRFEKSLVISDADVTFIKNGVAEYPYGFINPKIDMVGNSRGMYDDYSKRFYEKGNFEVSFSLDEYDINIEEIDVKYKITTTASGGNKAVEQYIFNNKTEQWEEGDYRNFKILKENFGKYLDSNNTLKFRISVLENDISGELPKISVKGSVK